MTTLHHGAHTRFAAHLGQCWVEDEDTAASYAGTTGTVTSVDVDLDGLTILRVSGYDREANESAGDHGLATYTGADLLEYRDEDPEGQQHWTLRVVSQTALDRIVSALTD